MQLIGKIVLMPQFNMSVSLSK